MWDKIKSKFVKKKEEPILVGNLEVVEERASEPVEIGFGDGTGIFCDNCKTPLTGGFCSGCGQKNTSLVRPIWYLISDLTEDIISKDSKLFRTIGQMLLMPGTLTRDFMDGKRARFIPPVRFYVLCTLTFFITLLVTDVAILKIEFRDDSGKQTEEAAPSPDIVNEDQPVADIMSQVPPAPAELDENVQERLVAAEEKLKEQGIEVDLQEVASQQGDVVLAASNDDRGEIVRIRNDGGIGFSAKMFMPAEPGENLITLPEDSFDGEKESIAKELEKKDHGAITTFFLEKTIKALDGIIHVSQDPRRLNNTLNDWVSKIMIILLPLFAILLRVFYWSKDNCLMKQLVFSLHFHSAIFLMMTFLVVGQVVWGAAFSATILVAFVPIYLFIAMKIANKQGFIRTFFKFMLVSFFYMLTLVMAVSIGLILSLAEV